MNMHCASGSAPSRIRDLLSLREVVVLADVPENRVRKDIETGVLSEPRVVRLKDSRLCFDWSYVFIVAAVYSNDWLNGRLRKAALSKIDTTWNYSDSVIANHGCSNILRRYKVEWSTPVPSVDLDKFVFLDMERVAHSISPRVGVYAEGLKRIEEKEDILGGEAVFKKSRLSVSHVGKMVESGESVAHIIEDYPYLNEDDVWFANLYYRAHPSIGRPRSGGDAGNDRSCA